MDFENSFAATAPGSGHPATRLCAGAFRRREIPHALIINPLKEAIVPLRELTPNLQDASRLAEVWRSVLTHANPANNLHRHGKRAGLNGRNQNSNQYKTMKIKHLLSTVAAVAVCAATVLAPNPALAGQGGTPQASVGLTDNNVALCFHNDTTWSLAKDPVGAQPVYSSPGIGTINWLITATKVTTTPNQLMVYGYLSVTNGGSGTATIGNIVINLQKQVPNCGGGSSGNIFVSAAADIANSTAGDVATLANIVAAASAEDATKNACGGAANYTVSAQV